MNVGGLPKILSKLETPKQRMMGISRLSESYDFVAYQENFYYAAQLAAFAPRLNWRIDGTRFHKWALLWPWLKRSGLTIASNQRAIHSYFMPYSKCFGHFRFSNDCWVPKGVLIARYHMVGYDLEIATTHMDAGQHIGDKRARTSQIVELRKLLGPVPPRTLRIVMGDFNFNVGTDGYVAAFDGMKVVAGHDVDYIAWAANGVQFSTHEVGTIGHGLSDHLGLEASFSYEWKV